MPNYVFNKLRVTGSAEHMKAFLDKAIVNGEWSMSNTFPTPTKIQNTISPAPLGYKVVPQYTNDHEIAWATKRVADGEQGVTIPEPIPCENNTAEKCAALIMEYGYDNWYDWNRHNWGCKWDCNDEHPEITDTSLSVSFDSAWSPPRLWLAKMIAEYPDLRFRLFCTEESEAFTYVFYTDEDGTMGEESGDYYHLNDEGEPCHYNGNGWVVTATGEEMDEDAFPEGKSTIEDYQCWFEIEETA